jgi:hypothetical protein
MGATQQLTMIGKRAREREMATQQLTIGKRARERERESKRKRELHRLEQQQQWRY